MSCREFPVDIVKKACEDYLERREKRIHERREKLIDKEMYLKEQVEKCWNASQNEGSEGSICNFTLNEIYNYLQSEIINRKLLQDERKIVANLLKGYINLTTGLRRKKSKILKKI